MTMRSAANALRFCAALGLLPLAACGFHPLYGGTATGPGIARTLSEIYVEPIPDRVGYQLRNALLDLFNATGRGDDAAYRLKLTLNEEEQAVALQTNTNITRYNYTLKAHYELIPKGSTDVAKSGDVASLTAYNVAAAPYLYATVAAERDAKERAANEIAERIRIAVAVYLRSEADKSR
jgi:LPS-assembly lipoprotein